MLNLPPLGRSLIRSNVNVGLPMLPTAAGTLVYAPKLAIVMFMPVVVLPEVCVTEPAVSTANVAVSTAVPSHLLKVRTKDVASSAKWILPAVVKVIFCVVPDLLMPVCVEPAVQSPMPHVASAGVVIIILLVVTPEYETVPVVTPSVVPKLELF